MPAVSLTDWYRERSGLPATQHETRELVELLERVRPAPASARPRHASASRRVELRAGKAPEFDIRLGNVREQIEEEIRDARWRFASDVEQGGWLYSLHRPRVRSVILCHASGPGRDSQHWPDRLYLSAPDIVEEEFADTLIRADPVRVGSWHSHLVAEPRPSPTDMNACAGSLERSGMLVWTSVIVTPHRESGWTSPELHGWQTHRVYGGGYVCEPARIVE